MKKLLLSLAVGFFFVLTSTLLLEAREPRDWQNNFGRVVLKSGVLEADRTFDEMENGVPTKVYVCVNSRLKYMSFSKLSVVDRRYVCQELGLPIGGDEKSTSSVDSSDWSGNFEAGTRKTFTINGVEFAFCYCPAGTFTMGSPSSEEERFDDETQHEVKLTKGFWMQETELTQEQWDALGVEKEEECRFRGKKLPVETASWDECVAFIDKLNESGLAPKGINFSLPTESQWEYACRAGATTAYSWGDSLNGDKANCDGNYPYGTTDKGKYRGKTSPVKSYDPNPWGLYDMHGNVWEWCSDQYDAYPNGSVTDPTGAADSSVRVIRGGYWNSYAGYCRSASRNSYDPEDRFDYVGFRLVAE